MGNFIKKFNLIKFFVFCTLLFAIFTFSFIYSVKAADDCCGQANGTVCGSNLGGGVYSGVCQSQSCDETCPKNWLASDGKCLMPEATGLTYSQSVNYCSNIGAWLPSVADMNSITCSNYFSANWPIRTSTLGSVLGTHLAYHDVASGPESCAPYSWCGTTFYTNSPSCTLGTINIDDNSSFPYYYTCMRNQGPPASSSICPTLSLLANPTLEEVNNNSTLSWSGTNLQTCTASGAWSGTKPISGSQSVTLPSSLGSSVYDLMCSNIEGSTVLKSVTVTSIDCSLIPHRYYCMADMTYSASQVNCNMNCQSNHGNNCVYSGTSGQHSSICHYCTGPNPSNATLYAGDNINLLVDTPKSLSSSNTAVKCEFQCNSGYTLSGGVCIPIVYTCTGTNPTNATMCSGDDTGLTANTPKTVVSSCTAPTKCEFTCNSGYTLSEGNCIPIAYTCTGTNPANATMCSGDNAGLTANTPKTVVSSCTAPTKCEFTCNSGYTLSGGNCLPSDGELLGFVWTETIGWISMTSKNHTTGPIFYGVVVHPETGHLSGYGWSENVGWVSFEYDSPFSPPSYSFNQSCYTYNDGDAANDCVNGSSCTACYNPRTELGNSGEGIRGLNGWARVYSLGDNGWIKLASESGDFGSTYGVKYNLFNNEFFGYAWNGNSVPDNYTGIGWVSFNCIDSGNNCAVSNYKVMADLNMPPEAKINETANINKLPCESDGFDGACSTDCELEPVVKWDYDDPEGYPQEYYRFILDSDNNPNNGNFYYDSLKTSGSLSQISIADLSGVELDYDTLYYVHIMVWDNFDLQAEEWESKSFTTSKHKYPEPSFSWFVSEGSAEEEIKFWDTSIYFERVTGNTDIQSSPGECLYSDCEYLWYSESSSTTINIFTPTARETRAVYKFDGSGQDMFLLVTDSDDYSCATSTVFDIKKRLPKWIEVR